MEEVREKEKREKEEKCKQQLRRDRQQRKENYLNNCPKIGHERRRTILAQGMNRNLHTEEEEWEYDKLAEEDIEENDKEYAIANRVASPATREIMDELNMQEEIEWDHEAISAITKGIKRRQSENRHGSISGHRYADASPQRAGERGWVRHRPQKG